MIPAFINLHFMSLLKEYFSCKNSPICVAERLEFDTGKCFIGLFCLLCCKIVPNLFNLKIFDMHKDLTDVNNIVCQNAYGLFFTMTGKMREQKRFQITQNFKLQLVKLYYDLNMYYLHPFAQSN